MLCKYCGTPEEPDPSDGMEYCPRKCFMFVPMEKDAEEDAQKSPEQIAGETQEGYDNAPEWLKSDAPHCWGPTCNKSTNMKEGIGDPPYKFICKLCGRSLRQHPFFGEGQIYDIANTQRVNAWKALTKQEKARVYARYNFPIPKWLL